MTDLSELYAIEVRVQNCDDEPGHSCITVDSASANWSLSGAPGFPYLTTKQVVDAARDGAATVARIGAVAAQRLIRSDHKCTFCDFATDEDAILSPENDTGASAYVELTVPNEDVTEWIDEIKRWLTVINESDAWTAPENAAQ